MRNLALAVLFAFALTGIAGASSSSRSFLPQSQSELRVAAPSDDGLDADKKKKKKKKDGGEEDEEEYRPILRGGVESLG